MTTPIPPIERFLAKTAITDHGLIWIGGVTKDGYPRFRYPCSSGETGYAYRFWYEYNNGEIPTGYEVNHSCHIRRCLTHLEAIPITVNRRRIMASRKARKLRMDSERRIYRGIANHYNNASKIVA